MQPAIQTQRLTSLDALRGFDMLFIMGGDAFIRHLGILFPDTILAAIGQQMGHSSWHGFTLEDLIFPLFLFIAGISFPFSLKKQLQQKKNNKEICWKIGKRGLTLIILGCIYNGLLQFDFENQRYASVLGRIGLAWMFAALLVVRFKHIRYIVLVTLILLIGYWILLSNVSAPDFTNANCYSREGALTGYIDRILLPGKLHEGIYDPEGILSTLPAIATALMGMMTGKFILWKHAKWNGVKKTVCLIGAGILLILVAQWWNLYFPINKKLWTSSFVCQAAGLSLLLFAFFYYIIDVRRLRHGYTFFTVIGINAITIYMAQIFINFNFTSKTLFGGICALFPENINLLISDISYIATCWLFLYFLYKHHIFLKV